MDHTLVIEKTGGLNNLLPEIRPEALNILISINRYLEERHIQAYLVGGFLRDAWIGRPTADIDIAIAADVLKVAPKMAEALGGKFVLLDEVNRIARVVLSPSAYVDLSTLEGNIDQDLARRDFTINAMAVDLKSLAVNKGPYQIIDPFQGQADLKRKILKAVDETVFEADPARLLRAVRLAAELNFKVTPRTETLIRKSGLIRVAGERVARSCESLDL
jgi:poly(A) polymerase